MTDIEWTDKTWNPVTGCSKVSAGCKNCYAETVANRFWGDRKFTDVICHPERLDAPLRWRKPQRVFVNSMSDLFHEDVPDEFIDRVFAVMALAPQHTFQVLTKRPKRMRDWVRDKTTTECLMAADESRATGVYAKSSEASRLAHAYMESQRLGGFCQPAPWPLPNVWLGVSCEDQAAADERIPLLLETPVTVRFVSAEPLLGPIDFGHLQPGDPPTEIDSLRGTHGVLRPHGGVCDRLSWVIVGGESGPRARPCDVAWIRSIVEQCRAAKVACFVKQLGAIPVGAWKKADGKITFQSNHPSARGIAILRDRKGGDLSEWPEGLCVREFPR